MLSSGGGSRDGELEAVEELGVYLALSDQRLGGPSEAVSAGTELAIWL